MAARGLCERVQREKKTTKNSEDLSAHIPEPLLSSRVSDRWFLGAFCSHPGGRSFEEPRAETWKPVKCWFRKQDDVPILDPRDLRENRSLKNRCSIHKQCVARGQKVQGHPHAKVSGDVHRGKAQIKRIYSLQIRCLCWHPADSSLKYLHADASHLS